jgi:hypothetical protein
MVELWGAIKKEVSNEEKMFISFTLYSVYKRLDSIALLLCVSCGDAGTMGGKSGFSARHHRVAKSGRSAVATGEIR